MDWLSRIFAWLSDHEAGISAVAAILAIAVLPLENLSRDPEQEYFADGYAALAQARMFLGIFGASPQFRAEFPKAREAVQRALEIDEHLGRSHAVLGSVGLWDWDFPGARRAYERALQLSPSERGRKLEWPPQRAAEADGRTGRANRSESVVRPPRGESPAVGSLCCRPPEKPPRRVPSGSSMFPSCCLTAVERAGRAGAGQGGSRQTRAVR